MSEPAGFPHILEAGREAAAARARDCLDSGQFKADLAALVAAPTESQNPAQRRCLA